MQEQEAPVICTPLTMYTYRLHAARKKVHTKIPSWVNNYSAT